MLCVVTILSATSIYHTTHRFGWVRFSSFGCYRALVVTATLERDFHVVITPPWKFDRAGPRNWPGRLDRLSAQTDDPGHGCQAAFYNAN